MEVAVGEPTVTVVHGRIGASGERLTDAGRPIAGADVTVPPDGIGELGEPAVLSCHQERS